jgi:hypothetical protein
MLAGGGIVTENTRGHVVELFGDDIGDVEERSAFRRNEVVRLAREREASAEREHDEDRGY